MSGLEPSQLKRFNQRGGRVSRPSAGGGDTALAKPAPPSRPPVEAPADSIATGATGAAGTLPPKARTRRGGGARRRSTRSVRRG